MKTVTPLPFNNSFTEKNIAGLCESPFQKDEKLNQTKHEPLK